MAFIMDMPVPWLGPSPCCEADDFSGIVAFMKDHPAAAASPELFEVFSRAAARANATSAAVIVPAHVRCAQVMLEMAVEWRLPAVERWAVAWLVAAGGTQLRFRWSSRSRDGRFRREAQASDRIVSITGHAGSVVLGLSSGAVESWAEDGAVMTLMPPIGSPVWAVAARDDWLVAAGRRNTSQTRGWSPGPSLVPEPIAGQKAAVISPHGHVAIGDESGRLRVWAPGRSWDVVYTGMSSPVRAIAFAGIGSGLIRAVWESGEVRELALGERAGTGHLLHRFPAGVHAAAWTSDGTMLAVATGHEVWLVSPGHRGGTAALLWTQPGVRAVAWSEANVLASASMDQIYTSIAPLRPSDRNAMHKSITSDEPIDAIALPDSDHVVSVQDSHLVQWELDNAGSDDPTFSADDCITAVGIQTADRRVTLAGTEQGRLREYSATGTLIREARLPNEPKIKQIAWDSQAKGWMVASLDGMYKYQPGEDPQDDTKGLVQLVAVGGGRTIYAARNRITTSDGEKFTLPDSVIDLHADRQGTFAAIDDNGHVLRQRQGEKPVTGPRKAPGTRLLDCNGDSLLFQEVNGHIRSIAERGTLSFGQFPVSLLAAARFDQMRIVLAYKDEGILLAEAGPRPNTWVPARVSVMAVNAGRIAVATPNHLAGYDVLDPEKENAEASVPLHIEFHPGGFRITLPAGQSVLLEGEPVLRTGRILSDRPDRPVPVKDLSEAVFQAGRIGDLLWQGGLDLAIDHARGQDPNRAVRLEWHCRAEDTKADRFPWELLHPSTAPLGWFDDPPITSVRIVAPAKQAKSLTGFASGVSPTMLVVRGTAEGLDAVDDAFDRFRRRSRRTDLRLIAGKPRAVGTADALAEELARPADIVQLWMHSGDTEVQLSDEPGGRLPTSVVADMLAKRPPRLVILVGCSSGALGRALVEGGVLAVLAMRVPVFDHTVQPLVEDVTATVLTGVPVDFAFALALRRYLLTGQPGAAAVPMLYLAENANSVLFPQH